MNKTKDTKKSCSNLERKYQSGRERVNMTQNAEKATKMKKGHKSEKGCKSEKKHFWGTKGLWEHETAMGTRNHKTQVSGKSGFRQMTKNICYFSYQTEGGGAQPQVERGLGEVAKAVTGGAGT